MITRRHFLNRAVATGAAAALGGIAAEPTSAEITGLSVATPPAGTPNVLIFMPDQQNGATVLPGSPVIKPNMDRFFAESLAFTAAHCPAPHCCPSRATFMSGLYPSEHGVYNNVETNTAIHLNPYPGTPFWGNALKQAGYVTGYSGKLHVGRDVTPETCGFENLEKTFAQQNKQQGGEHPNGQGRRKAQQENAGSSARHAGQILRPDWNNLQLYRTLPDSAYDTLYDVRIVRSGIAGMKHYASEGKPWCVMISNSGAHDTYDVPERFVNLYDRAKIELPVSFHDTLDDKPRVYQRQRYEYWSQLSDEETRDALLHYYAKCSMQDALFGEMLDALKETGQADNTIVIYVSDHGDYHAAHGLWMKGVPSFREAYHIPAVIRWPKGIAHAGRTVDALVDQADWAPTILEACGATSPKKLSGRSLMPWLRGETPADWRTFTCSQMNGVELYYTQRITMTKEWKYVYNGFDFDELYDLRSDPNEMHNLAFPDLNAKRKVVEAGRGLTDAADAPWPSLPPEAAAARKQLLEHMWAFASAHHDIIANPYGTVALAPLGPKIAGAKTEGEG